MSLSRRPPVSAEDIAVSKDKFRSVAAQTADTRDKIADTLEQLIASWGDPDGRRRHLVAEARRSAAAQRRLAGEPGS